MIGRSPSSTYLRKSLRSIGAGDAACQINAIAHLELCNLLADCFYYAYGNLFVEVPAMTRLIRQETYLHHQHQVYKGVVVCAHTAHCECKFPLDMDQNIRKYFPQLFAKNFNYQD